MQINSIGANSQNFGAIRMDNDAARYIKSKVGNKGMETVNKLIDSQKDSIVDTFITTTKDGKGIRASMKQSYNDVYGVVTNDKNPIKFLKKVCKLSDEMSDVKYWENHNPDCFARLVR